MQVRVVPCLKDNYAYLLYRKGEEQCAVVDPSEAQPVLDAAASLGLRLSAILNTHHHWDHVGGNEEIVRRLPGLQVYGHASDTGRIPEQTEFVRHGDVIELVGLSFRVLHIPGHTTGAIAYIGHGAAFTGDTLFAAGCGRLFEGTPADMYESLNAKLGVLPDDTAVYCGHEYTQNNLRFAASVEPNNPAIAKLAQRAKELRDRGEPTVPTTIADERAANPFMRCNSLEILEKLQLSREAEPASVLASTTCSRSG
jgi:hydroxyacylglutathione hydrolase